MEKRREMQMNREAKRYLRRLRRCLRCPRAARERFLGEVEAVMEDFLEENPDADYAALCAYLGAPWELAHTVCDTVPPEEMRRYFRRRTTHFAAVITLLAVLLCVAVWAITKYNTELQTVEVERTVVIING